MEERFKFYGRHLLLTFAGCAANLDDLDLVRADMVAAIQAAGATILATSQHRFDPHGLSIVFLLSESHASVHTYPESGSCFLDIFTCGRRLDVDRFEETLRVRWHPEAVSRCIKERT